ncbi:GEVED domain-containing protein [Epilithonimonas hungarica]|uniref:Por secretion system C-terminal sorting domain-containing protein n=1 Tax=Epilithonimonas hungarica TaxID=454006 RepID=A0A1G7V8T1_9FLAO|nr:GEVED domain-containing protein [Epilithonimonas hungarica]SDG56196.1 Por secretion system C-terminal sorting domain-containing protein [Epilithonimonas hungarica]
MKLKNAFFASLLLSGMMSAQSISIDTTVPGNPAPENSILEYWYWAYGIQVTGSGFAANSAIKFTSVDPQGGLRSLSSSTDASGNVTFQFNGWTNTSPLGYYTLNVADASGKTASGNYTVIKDPKNVITGTAAPVEFKMSDFVSGSTVKVKNLVPYGQVKINVADPAANGWELNKDEEMYADENGELDVDFNSDSRLFAPAGMVPLQPVEGNWSLSYNDWSGEGLKGSTKIRVLPNNPSTSSYCDVTATISEPITSVTFADISNATDPNASSSYENFLSKVGNLERGKEYKITVKGNTAGSWKVSTFTAFIDWNQNGTLDNENEIYRIGFVKGSTGMDTQVAELDIKVPDNAMVGNTRMRLLKVNSPSTFAMFWPTGACGNYNYGQIEDYTLNVKEALATSETSLNKVQFYPNPVKDVLTVSSSKKVNSVSVYNTAGQLIKTVQNTNTIDMSKLSAGVYVVKTDVEGKTETSKVIKK